MKSKNIVLAGACVAALAFGAPLHLFADTATPTPLASASAAASPSTSPSNRPVPYHGKISAVDPSAKTFTIAGKTDSRVIKVTETTRIMKDSGTGTMSDLQPGAMVRGSYWKKADGSLEAKSVKLGEKPAHARAHSGLITSPAPTPSATP
jgi:hypothetical protein